MIFIDTDILAIERIHKGDEKYDANSNFLHGVKEKGSLFTSIFNIIELCTVAANNLPSGQIDQVFYDFHYHPWVKVLYPTFNELLASSWFDQFFINEVLPKTKSKMPLPDAMIVNIAEAYRLSQFITWNTGHFRGKTSLEVLSPSDYSKKYLRM